MAGKLTHFDRGGAARMVDVGHKPETARVAVASGAVHMQPATAALVRIGRAGKGDVLGLALTAAILGLKRTADLFPLCHPVRVVGVDVALAVSGPRTRPARVTIRAEVHAHDRTGVLVAGRNVTVTGPAGRATALRATQFFVPVRPEPSKKCYKGGCSGQVCSDRPDVVTTCIYRAEYACYQQFGTCELQADGECAWTKTADLTQCLANPPTL